MLQRLIALLACLLSGISTLATAAFPGPTTEVRPLHGRPTFHRDGQPFTAPLFATYVPTEYYYRQMAGIGCKLFNFQTNSSACDIGFSTPTWKGPEEWDFSQMDERARNILKADPEALILPRIYIGTPQWWQEQHPEEMIVLDHGGSLFKEPCNPFMNVWKRPYPSLASKKWREDMGMALRRTLEHIAQSEWGSHVFGFEIAALGSEEWYHMTVNQEQLADYSPHMQRAFREWVQRKYATVEALRAAWGKPEIDFEQVAIPTPAERFADRERTFRDPARQMNVIDFYLFWNEIIPETIDYFAKIVKEETEGKKVVGAFYDYMYEFRGGPEFGHNGGGAIMRSENIDFICAPPSYHERQLGSGAECYRRPFLPGTLHNKIWFHDNDLVSFLFPRIMAKHNMSEADIQREALRLGYAPTAQESIWMYQRSAGFVLCEGIYESLFDLHGGYFDDPRLLQALTTVCRTIDEGKNHDRSSIAEVLVLADETSLAYGPFQSDYPARPHSNRLNQALLDHQIGFIKAGMPFDSGLLGDLDRIDFSRYKLVMFLNTWNIGDADRKIIEEKIKGNGRVIVWCYAPGYFNGNKTDADAMRELTGFNIARAADGALIEPKITLNAQGTAWMEQLGEPATAEPFGMEGRICELFSVNDPSAEPLGVLAGGDAVVMARKPMDDWTSIYTLTGVMPPGMVRALARSAGVHVYSTGNDTLYANKSYLTINAGASGARVIKLPAPADVYDALTDQLLYRKVTEFETSFMQGETQILRHQPAAD